MLMTATVMYQYLVELFLSAVAQKY